MAPSSRPAQECSKCPEDNRFLEYIQTEKKRGPRVGTEDGFDYVALYRCRKCGDVKRESFDPKTP